MLGSDGVAKSMGGAVKASDRRGERSSCWLFLGAERHMAVARRAQHPTALAAPFLGAGHRTRRHESITGPHQARKVPVEAIIHR